MEYIKNPKLEGTPIWDCRPQVGPCPNQCNQCFYNRPGAFYTDIRYPSLPDPDEVGNDIVRMNCGHDSNIQRELVLDAAKNYKHVFFNTSIPNLNFPGPVVFTINPKEEDYIPCSIPHNFDDKLTNVMFVRIRTSFTNLSDVKKGAQYWTYLGIPVVITFMSYYDCVPPGTEARGEYAYATQLSEIRNSERPLYQWKVRHINSYWCPTAYFQKQVMNFLSPINPRLVNMCGTFDSIWCKDCGNCEHYYWITKKQMDIQHTLSQV
jgi:hypothetical protein